MADRTDPRITRTDQALTQAIVELASQRHVSQITVADLADRAGVARATFYNRYSSPLELLIHVLYTDLERGHRREEARRAQGGYPAAQMLRLATADVAAAGSRAGPYDRMNTERGGSPPRSMAVSAGYAEGEPRRAAALNQPGDLMPVEAVGVDLGQWRGNA